MIPKCCFFLLCWAQAAILCLKLHRIRKKRVRRWWVRPINRLRPQYGWFNVGFSYMRLRDNPEFFEYTRMSPHKFDVLVGLVGPFLRKTSLRKPLPCELRLALTLAFLTRGDAARSLSWNYFVGRSTAFKVISETCEAIWRALQPYYLPEMTEEKWKSAALGFNEVWQFPNCCGALDGKHVQIQAPPNSGSDFFNYKKYFSIVLMACCDHRYKFTWVDTGHFGSISDGGVWSRSDFGAALEEGQANLPPPKNLPGTWLLCNHFLVGDEAFPLKTYLMRPFSRNQLGDAERVFNYRLSRARRVIENAFGILVGRWRILQTTVRCKADNAVRIMQALICLHNFLMTEEPFYCPPNLVDREDDSGEIPSEWRNMVGGCRLGDIGRLGANVGPRSAAAQRDMLRDYMISPQGETQAPWQYARAFRGAFMND